MHTSGTDCQGARSRSETDKASAPGQVYTFCLASHELRQVGQLQLSDGVLITLTLYTEANSSEYHRMISDNSETWHLPSGKLT